MNLFDKIKNFFKNIGKKQQALPEPEMMEEMLGEGGTNQFREELKFDPENLLDPRVCQGDKLIPNIMLSLGVDKAILENRRALIEIETRCKNVLDSKYFRPDYKLTASDIEAAVKRVKEKSGIEIDKYGATLSFSEFHEEYNPNERTTIGRKTNTTISSLDDELKGGRDIVIRTSLYKVKQGNEGRRLDLLAETKNIYSREGIALEEQRKEYNGEIVTKNKMVKSTTIKRDRLNPAIAQEEVIGEDGTTKTGYYAIDTERIERLNRAVEVDENGDRRAITFTNRGQISEYYEANKEKIKNAFANPKHLMSPELAYKLKYLAQQAGILPEEQQTEISE